MSLSLSPSPRAADPNRHACTGEVRQVERAWRRRSRSSKRIRARASTAGAARCCRLSVYSDAGGASWRRTIPWLTSRPSAFATAATEPRRASLATRRPVSGCVVPARTTKTSPSTVGATALYARDTFTLSTIAYACLENEASVSITRHVRTPRGPRWPAGDSAGFGQRNGAAAQNAMQPRGAGKARS